MVEQVGVGAALGDLPLLQHENQVGVLHGRDAVADDDDGAPAVVLAQVAQDGALGLRVDRREGVVEDQDAGPPDEGAGDGRALLLATRERDAALADERLEALGEVLDVGQEVGLQRGLLDGLLLGVELAEGDVVGHRIAEEEVKEITRIYAHLHRRGVPIRYLDVGGGLGINYDAGSTPGEGGISYSVEEYANAIVYSVLDVCASEGVPQPTLITENGRALTAHHSVLIVEVLGRNTKLQAPPSYTPPEDAHPVVQLLYDMWQDLRQPPEADEPQRLGRLLESYHDAIEQRQTADSLFAFGYLDLDQKAQAEQLYWSVCTAINERVHRLNPEWLPAELDHLDDHLVDQYLCDFSVFQSMMDYWSIGQRFPILPLHRLDEEPTRRATLVDLTCDSDGKVNRFISPTGEKRYLEVHPLRTDDRYFLAICLMGAYQDILGDNHNLFGSVSEVHVYADDEEPHGYFIENTIPGTTVQEMLGRVQYFPQDLLRRTQTLIQKKTAAGKLRPKEGKALLDQYRAAFDAYTYLAPEPSVRAERGTTRAEAPTNGHAPSTD